MIGQSLLHYEITAKLGEGGMGEVYRAKDSRLGRDVAIKVLPEIFLADEERLARFEREAQLLASLNHPNIGAIYGLEQADETRFLVLELIDGDTLQSLIEKGVSLEDALDMSAQVATALEAAHEQGVVHRDLKPANVIVTPGGTVKVLDFGLAKAWAPDAGDPQISASPTLTAQMTQAGMILGTAAYMSPEQARGQDVDKRADIWSFGVLTYEMITGQGLFGGDTVTDTLAAVVRADPDWESLPRRTPRRVRETLERCLEKDPARRLRDIGEARIVLEAAEPEEAAVAEGVAVEPSRFAWAPWAVAALAVVFALLAMTGIFPPRSDPPRELLRLQAELAPGDVQLAQFGANVAFSPDGRSVAYIGEGESRGLFLRELGSLEARAYTGTEDALQPFFSRDGEWIGFYADGTLKKVSVRGGAPLTLAEGTRASRGGSWGTDGYVYYAPHVTDGIWRVPDGGGEPEQVTVLADNMAERSHRFPQVLPSGEKLLMTVQPANQDFDGANIEVVDIATRERKVVHQGGSYGRYLASGHLVFVREGTLYAAPFDPARGELLRQPAPVLEGVRYWVNRGHAHLAFSHDGTMIYKPGEAQGGLPVRLTRLYLDGRQEALSSTEAVYRGAVPSPDGRRLAYSIVGEGSSDDIWVHDLERDVATRLTFDEQDDVVPVWTPDGTAIVFSSRRGGGAFSMYMKQADGTSEVERLVASSGLQFANTWLEDGRVLLFVTFDGGSADLMLLDMDSREVEPYLQTEFSEEFGRASPDGRWVAYESNESGQAEIYVRPYPMAAGKWQVSQAGGEEPVWSADGETIYYLGADAKVHAVDVTADASSFRPGADRVLFDAEIARFSGTDLSVHPDGGFVVLTGEEVLEQEETLPVFVFNWFEELNRLVPIGD